MKTMIEQTTATIHVGVNSNDPSSASSDAMPHSLALSAALVFSPSLPLTLSLYVSPIYDELTNSARTTRVGEKGRGEISWEPALSTCSAV